MGVISVKRNASLETYSKRTRKSKSTYQKGNPETKMQEETELPQTAVPLTPLSRHRPSDPVSTDLAPSLRKRRRMEDATDPMSSCCTLPASQTSEDLISPSSASPSTARRKSKCTGACSPRSRERGSELPSAPHVSPSRTKLSESPSQDSTGSLHLRGSNSPSPKGSTIVGDITTSRPSKKRAYGSQTSSQDELPPTKKLNQSITGYFKPLPRSASSAATPSCHTSSDTPKYSPTPPSSPPRRSDSPISYARKPQKRRLTTKPSLPPINMSSDIQYGRFEEYDDTISFMEAVGDMVDENRVEPAEQTLDREEARDAIQSDSSGISRSAYLANSGNACASISRSRSKTAAPNLSKDSSDENDATRARSKTSAAGPIANANISSRPIPIPQRKHSGLKQLYFDLHDGDGWVQCKECDRYYDTTSQRSKAAHEIEHNKRLYSKVTKKEISTLVLAKWDSDDDKTHCIVVIDCKQAIAVRSHAQAVLGVTSESLGPIHVNKEELWGEIPDPQSTSSATAQVPRFRIFVHYVDDEVVSVILAERIREGCGYHAGRSFHDDGSPLLAEGGLKESLLSLELGVRHPAWVSIERIWVRDGHRRKGYATKMVDFVRENFVRGLPLAKNQIAFSWPFANGIAFASKYCRGVFGDAPFLVNADEVRH